MRFFGWLAFLVALIVAVLAVQNAALPAISMKLFVWQVETSPILAVAGSLIAGVLITVFLWIPYVIRESFRRKYLRKQIEVLQEQRDREAAQIKPNCTDGQDSFV